MGLHNEEEAVQVGLREVRRIEELQRQLCEEETLAEGGEQEISTDHHLNRTTDVLYQSRRERGSGFPSESSFWSPAQIAEGGCSPRGNTLRKDTSDDRSRRWRIYYCWPLFLFPGVVGLKSCSQLIVMLLIGY